jgi:(R,R)-butanediol dehydrogenase/meso-butanediol dehydrogenase/diacetyl reductase
MKAAVWHGVKDVQVEDVLEPSPAKGWVKIKVKQCSICGTDLHEYRNGPVMLAARPHPVTGRQVPLTLGHEFSGDIVELGEGVTGLKVGDRVTVNPLIVCGTCWWCRRAIWNECARLATIGLAWDGAFAEYVTAPDYGCYKLPDTLSYEAAALTEPFAVTVRAAKRGEIKPGDSVAIIGAGPIGLLTLEAVKAAGATQIFVIEPVASRCEVAMKLGATATFDPTKVDPGREIGKLTEGRRADVAFECVGGPHAGLTLGTALAVSRRAGRIVMVGVPAAKGVEFDFFRLFLHEKQISAVQGYVDEFPAAISLLAGGRVDTNTIITSKIKLDRIVPDGFESLIGEPEKNIKIIVSPE